MSEGFYIRTRIYLSNNTHTHTHTKYIGHPNFCFYDFNDCGTIPENLRGSFDLCVVDPPFITEDVWRKYAEAVKPVVIIRLLLYPYIKCIYIYRERAH